MEMAVFNSVLAHWFWYNMISEHDLALLEEALDYQFADKRLAVMALTHRSLRANKYSYERLEFLGDKVLALILSEILYHKFADADQGELTKRYHPLAKESALATIAVSVGLPSFILSDGISDVHERASVQSDVTEAIIAALYLDGGMEEARKFVLAHWVFDDSIPDDRNENPKSALQEWAAPRQLGLPAYSVLDKQGPDHALYFSVEVVLNGVHKAQGEGLSRKIAEQDAARNLLSTLIKG
jgi:ribonuclease-3